MEFMTTFESDLDLSGQPTKLNNLIIEDDGYLFTCSCPSRITDNLPYRVCLRFAMFFVSRFQSALQQLCLSLKMLLCLSLATILETPLDIDLWYDVVFVNKLVLCAYLYSSAFKKLLNFVELVNLVVLYCVVSQKVRSYHVQALHWSRIKLAQ